MGGICSRSEHVVQPLHDLTAEDLATALGVVGDYLRKKRKNLILIAVGGAINTLYLHSRISTHDADFFSRNLTYEELTVLNKACQKASTTTGAPTRWLNNQTSLYLTHDVRLGLVAKAIAANVVIFQRGGLTLLAAPWRYSLCSKLNRIHQAIRDESKRRDYDIDDAAAYLNRLVVEKGGPLPRSGISEWLTEFGLSGADIFDRLNEAHTRVYSVVGIVGE
jgi:hypothetical protein